MAQRIKVKAPATVSNLNCGFDVLGMAIDVINDEIIGERTSTPGVQIKLIGPHARQLPAEPDQNTAGVAVNHFLEFLGVRNEGVALEIHKRTRPGSGLGSSASSACAAVFLANELFGRPLDKRALLPFAILGEHAADGAWHADNVAPCLLGGVVLIRDLMELDMHRVYTPEGLFCTVVFPDVRILTSESRGVLQPQVSMRQMVRQTANLGALVLALEKGDLDLLGRAMVDHVVEAQRAHLIPGYHSVKEAALREGVLSCGIAGAGPTVFALANQRGIAEASGVAMAAAFRAEGVDALVYTTGVDQSGVMRC